MSTPRTLTLPDGVVPGLLTTPRGTSCTLSARAHELSRGTVLLVPGWTGSKEDFAPLLPALADLGWDAVAYDQRGQLDTVGSGDEADYTLSALGADLAAIADVLDSPVHVVGHSFGGLVARAAVRARAQTFASLTLLCSGPGAQPVAAQKLLITMAETIASYGLTYTWAAKRAYDITNPRFQAPAPEIEEWLQHRFTSNDPVSLRAMTLHLAHAPTDAAPVPVPTLVAYGEGDDGWPIEVQDAMAASMGAAVEVIEGAGHSPAIDQPESTAKALGSFWESVG